jgi:hypothetical protein
LSPDVTRNMATRLADTGAAQHEIQLHPMGCASSDVVPVSRRRGARATDSLNGESIA